MEAVRTLVNAVRATPLPVLGAVAAGGLLSLVILVYITLYLVAPIPRAPLAAEKTFTFISEDGSTRRHHQLPCWYDKYVAEQEAAAGKPGSVVEVEPAEVFVSLVVPAYNEEARLDIMLTEAAAYLEQHYGAAAVKAKGKGEKGAESGTSSSKKSKQKKGRSPSPNPASSTTPSGYEIIVVSDGSTDRTIETALAFARKQLPAESRPNLRVVSLERNRGKGGAVTHGLRHVRGAYALFADADGATRFSDLGAVLQAAQAIEAEGAGSGAGYDTTSKSGSGGGGSGGSGGDGSPRARTAAASAAVVSVGSRAHMVNTPAVVKRSALRNLLMRGFHLFLRLMTPPRTARIGDTQCGFKLFSRAALPAIVPWMHLEGWVFDVEMLMLAEIARIPVAEVPVGWKEIGGSKLNVVWDSLGMACGLAVLRGAWLLGVYRRKW